MKIQIRIFSLLAALAIFALHACTTSADEDTVSDGPDYAISIVGNYDFTTLSGGTATGTGKANISKLSNNEVQITTEQGIDFKAEIISASDTHLYFDIPTQPLDYYQIESTCEGSADITAEGRSYDAVYFAGTGELNASIIITYNYNGQSEGIIIKLKR